MLRTMLRELLAHRGRLLMTLLAIALGVAATVGSWVVSDSIATTLAGRETRHDVGVSVQSPGKEPLLAQADLARLAAVPGVARAEGVIVGRAGIIGRDNKLVEATTVLDRAGTNWSSADRFTVVAGQAPTGPGQVALNAADAETAGLAVGDDARILLADGHIDHAEVTALFTYHQLGPESTSDSNAASDAVPVVAYDTATATELLGNSFHRIELTGGDPEAIKAGARQVVPADYHVATGDELAEDAVQQAEADVQDLRMTMLPFAAVALLVGMFVIANTFTMLVTQRTRQFALLRAVGARKRQVRAGIVIEAAVLGVAGGTVGTLAGVAIGPLLISVLRPDDEVTFTVSPFAILLGYGVAVLTTVLAAYGSARRAAAVPPVAALRTDSAVPRETRRMRNLIGIGLLIVAAAMVTATADPSSANTARIIALVGAVLGVVGMILLAPRLAEFVLRPITRFSDRRSGPPLRLALRNAAGDPRRTSGAATAITVGLALVCAFATLSASFSALIASTFRANVPGTTTVLQSAAGGESTLTPAELDDVGELPGVTQVAGSRDLLVKVTYAAGETVRRISAIEPTALGTVLTPKITAGSADLTRGVVVSRNQADMLDLGVHDEITLQLDARTSITQPVVGVYDATELQASIFLDVAKAPESLRKQITTLYAAGPDPAEARRSIETAFRHRPDVVIGDRESLIEQGVDRQALAFTLMYAMFGVAILIALFGVVNTLVLAVLERTREIGVFRAVGATRLLVRRMITVESVVLSIFGALLGVVIGVPVGAVMQHAMFGQRLSDFTLPTTIIAVSLVGIVLAAVVAAMWPARRAARTNMLAAITDE
ncbi:FtsX-like permease family protein [Saccharopolyspora sp. K220]|uniref:ABC transporter permease n=1 Tax=Saccharopolyspora soli TaxID=2926618 RepID=UPI001F582156|nr:FtsX-like permease family protein [Saccharopolyspora soli]MCI2422005.1 FtsX-like permease family protein [Saccharopolyspora soli]